jgi:LysR family glycine cleavage system transcriptional activator
MLNADDLRCFIAAAHHLNFTRAAREVSLTPAALGQRVRHLEIQLTCSLFQRTTRTVTLTRQGLQLLPYAEQIIALGETATKAVRGELGPTPVDLTIGTRHELGMSFVLPLLPQLKRTIPELTCHLYFGSSSDLLVRVRTSEIDCVIGSMRIRDPRLTFIELQEEKYVLVAAPKLLHQKPFRRPEDAGAHVLMDTHPDLPLFDYLRDATDATWHFGKIVLMGTIAALRVMALSGAGVAVLPHYLVRADLRARRLIRVMPRTELLSDRFRLIFRANDSRRALYEQIAERFSQEKLQ